MRANRNIITKSSLWSWAGSWWFRELMRNSGQNVTKKISELRRHQKGQKYSKSNNNTQRITILPSYLQFTMMLAVAAAGVPTPLLAMHWYWILQLAVVGLVTFTTVSREALDRKSELPTLVHFMLGFGLPDAAHVKFKLLPSTTVFNFGETVTFGASDKR